MLVRERHEKVADNDRPRERLRRLGLSRMRDSELIMLILGSGVAGRPVVEVAADVLALLDTTNSPPSLDDLSRIRGLGPARSATVAAAFELARRVLSPARRRIQIPSDALPMLDRFSDRKQEHFLTLSLNGAHEVIVVRTVSVGLVNRTMVHPREVFAGPLTDRAAAVILAHNHPSGSLEPSSEDNEITRRLVAAGQTLGIPVLDHVIFGSTGYHSYLENDAL
jgi:DNA repair protein RadC